MIGDRVVVCLVLDRVFFFTYVIFAIEVFFFFEILLKTSFKMFTWFHCSNIP
jgi:hypothetical protein